MIRSSFQFQACRLGEVSAELVQKRKKLSDKLLLMVSNSKGTIKLISEEHDSTGHCPLQTGLRLTDTLSQIAMDFLPNSEIPLDY